MKKVSANLEDNLAATENQPFQMPFQPATKQSTEVSFRRGGFSEDDKRMLVNELGACQIVQRTYGKQAGDLGVMVKVFLEDLDGYDGLDVINAITEWRRKNAEFPTPADILAILNPEPKFDYAVYQKLSKKAERDGTGMTDKEWKYIKAYERQAMKGI